jgi:hypothetical protein|tara:strand:- start:229 stop:459 length:231 start_codon:yes stop_codon:yes gene_type:complete
MKLPSEIETPLDRRAMTIDILAAEIERKNRTIKKWRQRFDEMQEKYETEIHLVVDELSQLKAKKKSNGKAKLNEDR